MTILQSALDRLRAARAADRAEPWRPGKQPADATVLMNYIERLENELSLAKDELFLRSM